MKLNKVTKRPMFVRPEILLQELPKPLHTITPRFIMGGDKWSKAKRQAAASNNYCCWCCGVNINDTTPNRLEGSPIIHTEFEWKIVYFRGVAAVCYKCNSFINLSSVRITEQKGLRESGFSQTIIHHGAALVNVLQKIENINNAYAINDFKNWRYNFDGVEYSSRFDSNDDYNAFFNLKKVG